MNQPRAAAPIADLTIPEPGSSTAREVLSRAIGKLLRELRGLVRAHAALAPPADVEAFERVLAAALRDHVGPLASVLRRPNVSTLARTLRRAPTEGDAEVFRELIAVLTFELAVLGELPFDVTLQRVPRRLLSMAAELALELPDDVESVTLRAGRMRVVLPGGTHDLDLEALGAGRAAPDATAGLRSRRPFTLIDGGTWLATEDNNPLSLEEAHPNKSGNAVDLGDAPVSSWVESLRTSFRLVERYLPDLRREMELYLSQIVPVGTHAEKHLSASFREAIGTIYLTLHPQQMTMVEALIHEFQHNKLNTLLDTDDLLENAFFPLYKSPVRPDPRPLHGVLLAVHAFLPVARLYERMLEEGDPVAGHASFRGRLRDIVAINREGASVVLEHARPTAAGAGLIDEIRRLDSYYRCLP